MTKAISLIYAYWPNQPFGATWCDLPWALRDAGLPKRLSDAGHQVLETFLMAEDPYPEELASGFELAGQIAADVAKAKAEGELAIILCGSCTIAAVGAISGLNDPTTAILWCDAHPDLNTPETTTSGLLEGMALATATGQAWQAMASNYAGLKAPASLANATLFGAREIDDAEHTSIIAHQALVTANLPSALQRLTSTATTYVHLDMDVHDAMTVRTNAHALKDGPSVETIRDLLEQVPRIDAMAVTGLDPKSEDNEKACAIAIDHILAVAAKHAKKS